MKKLYQLLFLLLLSQSLNASLAQFKQDGYIEICNEIHSIETFNSLYTYFDELIAFLQENPPLTKQLYIAKERFIRSKEKQLYSTDFFGFYDESEKEGRCQISFYYSPHFHEFICSHYPELLATHQILHFLEACYNIQQGYSELLDKVAADLDVEAAFSSLHIKPLLFKVIKYLPSYKATRPHYDGSALSLFLDSTDNHSLLISPYKDSFSVDDFYTPLRNFQRHNAQNSILIIPGTLLTEFSIYPTPHIVKQSGKTRYATIAFAMRPNDNPQKIQFPSLPYFKD